MSGGASLYRNLEIISVHSSQQAPLPEKFGRFLQRVSDQRRAKPEYLAMCHANGEGGAILQSDLVNVVSEYGREHSSSKFAWQWESTEAIFGTVPATPGIANLSAAFSSALGVRLGNISGGRVGNIALKVILDPAYPDGLHPSLVVDWDVEFRV